MRAVHRDKTQEEEATHRASQLMTSHSGCNKCRSRRPQGTTRRRRQHRSRPRRSPATCCTWTCSSNRRYPRRASCRSARPKPCSTCRRRAGGRRRSGCGGCRSSGARPRNLEAPEKARWVMREDQQTIRPTLRLAVVEEIDHGAIAFLQTLAARLLALREWASVFAHVQGIMPKATASSFKCSSST